MAAPEKTSHKDYTGSVENQRYTGIIKGAKLIANAKPRWDEAQRSFRNLIGDERWTVMRGVLGDTTRVVRHRNDTAS